MSSNQFNSLTSPEDEQKVRGEADNIAIRVSNLSKCYQIYDTPRDRLKQFVMPRLQTMVGQQVKQYFREFWALKDVSFEIKKGETVGVIGRNGSGKSSLLQIICGTLTPTSGIVETNGRIAALLELGSGFNPEFTGRENVYMNAAVLGLTREEVDIRFDAIASFADIGEFIEQPVKTYSSGMFVRLAFAIQANVDPEILIVDEALAVGDAYFVHRCMHRFHELQEGGTTILFVSHDAVATKQLCSKTLWLDRGSVAMTGNSERVVDAYIANIFYRRNVPIENSAPKDQESGSQVNDERHENFIEDVIPNMDRRIGDQRCVVNGVSLRNKSGQSIASVESGAELEVHVTLRNGDLDAATPVVFGYIIRDQRGVEIASANSSIEGVDLGGFASHRYMNISARITFPLLHPGNYALCVAAAYIEHAGTIELADRIDNVLAFSVYSSREFHSPFIFDTDFQLKGLV